MYKNHYLKKKKSFWTKNQCTSLNILKQYVLTVWGWNIPILTDMLPQKVLIVTEQYFLMEKYAVRKLLTRLVSDLLLRSSAKLPVSPTVAVTGALFIQCTPTLNKCFSPRPADGRFSAAVKSLIPKCDPQIRVLCLPGKAQHSASLLC